MRLLVCGGRDFKDSAYAFRVLDLFDQQHGPVEVLIEGGQRTFGKFLPNGLTREIIGGADYWAFKWAEKRRIFTITERADWDRYGDKAGPIRNNLMLKQHKPDCVLGFPGDTGTAHMLRISAQQIRPYRVRVIRSDDIVPEDQMGLNWTPDIRLTRAQLKARALKGDDASSR